MVSLRSRPIGELTPAPTKIQIGRSRDMGRGVRATLAAPAQLGLLLAVLTACGSGSSDVIRPPSGSAPSTRPDGAVSSTATHLPVNPKVTVVPARELRDGQRVQVRASGFSANEALQMVECADKGQATGPGDCNLAAMIPATSDGGGRLTATLKVAKGPFGANGVVCSAKQRCLISVTQASLNPVEEADAPIRFAPR